MASRALSGGVVAVGGGVVGALAFGAHYLRNSSDVIVDKKRHPEPWNDVEQHKNTKLFSSNRDFWQTRASNPPQNPREMFRSPSEARPEVVQAKEKAVEGVRREMGLGKESSAEH
ncbi:NADH dehydrogenase [Rhodotorula toruloides]|nr:NADH dehydrogenase [Rhodotorula toruloides]